MAFQNVDFMKEKKKKKPKQCFHCCPTEGGGETPRCGPDTVCVRHDKDVNAKGWKSLSGLWRKSNNILKGMFWWRIIIIFFSREGLGLVDVGKRVFTVHITVVQSTFDYTSLAKAFMLSVSTSCHSVARTTCGERKTFRQWSWYHNQQKALLPNLM